MSMISAQIDELRELATRYDELQVGAVKAVKMPSNMGSILREAADTIWQLRDDLQRAHRDNAKLREQMERLVTLLRVDCDIEASWDGLRKFWSIGLTEGGCLMRDRACKAEGDNAKLRESVKRLMTQRDERLARAEAENAKLRELVRWMYDRMDESCAVQHPYAPAPISYDHLMQALARARELGVEVSE